MRIYICILLTAVLERTPLPTLYWRTFFSVNINVVVELCYQFLIPIAKIRAVEHVIFVNNISHCLGLGRQNLKSRSYYGSVLLEPVRCLGTGNFGYSL